MQRGANRARRERSPLGTLAAGPSPPRNKRCNNDTGAGTQTWVLASCKERQRQTHAGRVSDAASGRAESCKISTWCYQKIINATRLVSVNRPMTGSTLFPCCHPFCIAPELLDKIRFAIGQLRHGVAMTATITEIRPQIPEANSTCPWQRARAGDLRLPLFEDTDRLRWLP